MRKGFKRSMFSLFAFFTAGMLVCSFGLHTLQLEHVHPGDHVHTHSGDQEMTRSVFMHSFEEKFFMLFLLGLLAVSLGLHGLCFVARNRVPVRNTRRVRAHSPRVRNYLLLLFSRGILHSKAH